MELYIHIPFCLQKCSYCDFVSYPDRSDEWEPYITMLLAEAEKITSGLDDSPCVIETVYIGGGTPSLLPSHLLSRMINGIKQYFDFSRLTEFTVEANPGTVTPEWAEAAQRLGVNRISLGMQAAQPRILKFLGRIHTFEDVQHSVGIFRSAGFANLSLDLMFGIPGQSVDDWRVTLDAALSLSPDHISAYGLIPEEGTSLFENLRQKKCTLPDPESEREMYDLAISRLKQDHYYQYEISNFARPGYACQHNIGYWSQVPYIGLGASAASMLPPGQFSSLKPIHTDSLGSVLSYYRRKNPDSLEAYDRMNCSTDFADCETDYISGKDAEFETMMLGLRMNKGVSDSFFTEMHGIPMDSVYGNSLSRLSDSGLLIYKQQICRLTRKGMDLQNSVLLEFM